MTANESLDIIRGLLARIVPTEENTATTNEAWEALSVLRSVVEDYEKARPLLDEISKAEVGNYWTENSDATGKAEFTFYDDRPIILAALAYRAGRKP